MSKPLRLSKEAFSLLERLMSTANARIRAASLAENDRHLRQEWVEGNWLLHCGTETEVICTNDEERPYEYLEWDSERKQYKYFNPYDGWVFVDPELLKIYEVNQAQFLTCLQQTVNISDRSEALAIQEDSLWYRLASPVLQNVK